MYAFVRREASISALEEHRIQFIYRFQLDVSTENIITSVIKFFPTRHSQIKYFNKGVHSYNSMLLGANCIV